MAKHVGQFFAARTVELDGNRYENCNFQGCKLIYRGGNTTLIGCTFSQCDFGFADAAERTLGFLTAMYKDGGGANVIEGIFDQIRSGGMRQMGAGVEN